MGRRKSTSLKPLPKGISIHGKSLRITFPYKGRRCRESLGIEPTNSNIDYAAGFRATILHEIKTHTFRYEVRFPDSPMIKKLGISSDGVQEISLGDLRKKYEKSRSVDLFYSSMDAVEVALNVSIPLLGDADRLVSSLLPGDIDDLRADLKEGRKNSTVNGRLDVVRSFLEYAYENKYTSLELFKRCKHLKTDSDEDIPDPLEEEEFDRLIASLRLDFHKHLITFAVYTGMRAGELVSLAWQDVNLKSGTATVRRSLSKYGFKLTKTSKTRTIDLLPPAREALKQMRLLTALFPEAKISVYQRDKAITKSASVRFVFNPQCYRKGSKSYLSPRSLSGYWKTSLARAGIRHRRFHQTRHTFACWTLSLTGNPAYIADQLGHKDFTQLVQTYGKWMPSKSQNEADRIWEMMCMRRGEQNIGSGQDG